MMDAQEKVTNLLATIRSEYAVLGGTSEGTVLEDRLVKAEEKLARLIAEVHGLFSLAERTDVPGGFRTSSQEEELYGNPGSPNGSAIVRKKRVFQALIPLIPTLVPLAVELGRSIFSSMGGNPKEYVDELSESEGNRKMIVSLEEKFTTMGGVLTELDGRLNGFNSQLDDARNTIAGHTAAINALRAESQETIKVAAANYQDILRNKAGVEQVQAFAAKIKQDFGKKL